MIVGLRKLIALVFLLIGLSAGMLATIWGGGALPVWYVTAGGVVADIDIEAQPARYLPEGSRRHAAHIRLANDERRFTYRAPLTFRADHLSQMIKTDDPVVIIYRSSGLALCGSGDGPNEISGSIWHLGCGLLVGLPNAIVRLTSGDQEPISYLDTVAPDVLVFLFLLWAFIVFTRLGYRGLSAAD